MENENLRNIENLLATKASTQSLYEFPVDQLPLGLRDSLFWRSRRGTRACPLLSPSYCRNLRRPSEGEVLRRQRYSDGTHVYHHRRAGIG